MSINVRGTLNVAEVPMKNGGTFCTGELVTAVGKFVLKHNVLSQFQTGSYEGDFIIESIYMATKIVRNASYTELRASLDWEALALLSEGELDSSSQASLEAIGNIEEHFDDQPENIINEEKPKPQQSLSDDEDLICDEETLLSAIQNKASIIKLDSSLGRGEFVRLKDIVKNTKKYQYKSEKMSWILLSEEAA
ncbi:DUF3275 family protein [Neisseria sp. Ec49-e6-T10]|uniref:DUF3275 family protein n=1 Tax=Neisseria sp. Ec49-e6-T10 TaxID=3140744 RepID=UPI003EB8E857